MRSINIGLLGCGTVGTGVARLLHKNQDLLQSRVGAELNLIRVADIDLETDRGVPFAEGVLTRDADSVVADPSVDIVIELIGGQTTAKDLILKAIDNGKHVVTANKALLAAHGSEIFGIAAAKDVELAFEASVGGCMPIIKTLRESLVGNRIESLCGILNGTCNYILSKITDDGGNFASALAEAQVNGFAEADPTLDIDGFDTAHKLAILTAIAFGTPVNLNEIYVEGIRGITSMDIALAGSFGYRIKLLAIGKDRGDAVEARVHPTMIPFDNLLSSVNGALNAVTITGDAVGDILLYGRGAGMMPTASAVVGDVVDIARNMLTGARSRIPTLAYLPQALKKVAILPIEDIDTHYYVRFAALDRPGVLSKISGILGDHGISIKSVHQKGRKINGSVPIVMLTHLAKEASIKQALAEITALEVVTMEPVLIRIEDDEERD